MTQLDIPDDLALRLMQHADMRGMSVEMMLEQWLNGGGTGSHDVGLFLKLAADMRLFFQLSSDLLCVLDEQARFISVNRAYTTQMGYSQDELLGRSLMALVHPDDSKRARETLAAHVSGWPAPTPFEIRLLTRGGDQRWTSWSFSPSTEGKTFAIAHDVTEQKAWQREIVARNEELDAFSGAVAHDLKTPIASIIGFASLLETYQDRVDADMLRNAIYEIMQAGFQAREIIDSLLLLARVRRTHQVPVGPLDMYQIIETVTERLRSQIAGNAAVIQMPDEWPSALGYAPWVEQIWVNYISNAIKYGGEPPLVRLGADHPTDDGNVRFWVEDNGSGIDPAQHARLFKPFTRLDHNRQKVEGHGLGLSIVKRIVDRLGGDVGIEGSSVGGSRFSFTLPTP